MNIRFKSSGIKATPFVVGLTCCGIIHRVLWERPINLSARKDGGRDHSRGQNNFLRFGAEGMMSKKPCPC